MFFRVLYIFFSLYLIALKERRLVELSFCYREGNECLGISSTLYEDIAQVLEGPMKTLSSGRAVIPLFGFTGLMKHYFDKIPK